jgi:hypothetical protein
MRSFVLCGLQMASALRMMPTVTPRAAATPRATVNMMWHIFPRDGATGMLKNDYWVERGQQQVVGRYDMVEYDGQKMEIAPDQCVMVPAEDGSALYVYAQGQQPTGWRTRPDEPWNWMNPGESVALYSGHKISLDCNYPESAVYKFEKSGMVGTGALPPGWTTGYDQASAQQFYYNQQTGQTQWEVPQY